MKYMKHFGLALSLLIIVPAAQAVGSEGGYDSTALLLFPGQAMMAVSELPKKIEDLKISLAKLKEQAFAMKKVKNTKEATIAISASVNALYATLQNDIEKIFDLMIPTMISACKILGDPKLKGKAASEYMVMLDRQIDDIVAVVKDSNELLQRVAQTMIVKPQVVPAVEIKPFDE